MTDENGRKIFYSWVLSISFSNNWTIQRDDSLFIQTIPQSVSFDRGCGSLLQYLHENIKQIRFSYF